MTSISASYYFKLAYSLFLYGVLKYLSISINGKCELKNTLDTLTGRSFGKRRREFPNESRNLFVGKSTYRLKGPVESSKSNERMDNTRLARMM